IRYIYDDFAPNILSLNIQLADLQLHGVLDLILITEGNPEVYDFLECLSTYRKKFVFEEITQPLVITGCEWIKQTYGANILSEGYILTSGYNLRHGITVESFTEELQDYLETNLTC